MRILVTAGNTQAPIDRVRCITNIFTGRTGAGIASHAHDRNHHITLLTSHPETVTALPTESDRWKLLTYRTFEDLQALMAGQVQSGGFDAIVHCAAVSDYLAAGVFSPTANSVFDTDGRWQSTSTAEPAFVDRTAGKVKSDEPELWIHLVRAPKLVDRIRSDWAFRGVLVKFKLEADISDEQLLEIAESSRRHSEADLMAANTLEGAQSWAFLGPLNGSYHRIARADLPARLIDALEQLHKERRRG